MFYTKNTIKFSLFNKINLVLKKCSKRKKDNKILKQFNKIHSVLWIEFMLLHYLSGDDTNYINNSEEKD